MKKSLLVFGAVAGLILMGCPVWYWFTARHVVNSPPGESIFAGLGATALRIIFSIGMFSFVICGVGVMIAVGCLSRLKGPKDISRQG